MCDLHIPYKTSICSTVPLYKHPLNCKSYTDNVLLLMSLHLLSRNLFITLSVSLSPTPAPSSEHDDFLYLRSSVHGNHFSAFAAVNWTPGGHAGFDHGNVHRVPFTQPTPKLMFSFCMNAAGFGYGRWGRGKSSGWAAKKT